MSIVRGGTFLRSDYPDDQSFKNALGITHTELHGKPIEWDGTKRLYARDQLGSGQRPEEQRQTSTWQFSKFKS